MPTPDLFDRAPSGALILRDEITDLGFRLGPPGTPVRIRLALTTTTVIEATIAQSALERFARQWVKLLRP